MRPDPHKQAASRKYHSKVRSRGGGAAGATADSTPDTTGQRGGRGGGRGGSRGGRGGRGGYRGRNNEGDQDGDEAEGGEEDGAPRKSYARRKITSNADRYTEREEEVTEAEELDQGIDRQTIAFRELLKDSDQKKSFDPAAYFRFKSEKEVETQDPMEESQQARKLLEIRLDGIEKALMILSVKDRLYLRDSDVKALDRDMVGKVSLSTGKPIVPKLVRGQAATDILIKAPTIAAGNAPSPANSFPGYSRAVSGSLDVAKQASIDDDLDELLDITKTYGRARPSTVVKTQVSSSATSVVSQSIPRPPESTSGGSKMRLAPLFKGTKAADASGTSAPKGLPPLKKGPPRSAGKKDEEWLDSVLGI
ncbi:hypothetical protein EDD21DRAFT_364493 [Dissophora ornata]|nr:hypothetical protein BGZ58_001036 [Dissophora ornata]KAI8605097.1 hypothetical protein EDD21DRAFT_364493 [Dissophora ornata]